MLQLRTPPVTGAPAAQLGTQYNRIYDVTGKKQFEEPSMAENSSESPPDGASVVLYQGNQVLLYKRDGHPKLFPNRWAILGGGIEAGESPEETVCRELQVEVGYRLAPGDLAPLGRCQVLDSAYRYLVHYFRAELKQDYWDLLLNLGNVVGLEREGEGIALFSHDEVDFLHLTCPDRLALERHFRGRDFGFID